MSKITDTPGDHVRVVRIGAQSTAGSTDAWPIFEADEDLEITKATWIPAAAVTGDDTNNFAFAVQNKGTDGSGSTAVTDTKTYATSTDSVAHAPEDLTLSTTDGNLDIDAGEVIALVRTVNGTGLASPDGVLQVAFRYR